MRRFVIIGQSALASDDFLLEDFAGTSGRLDVLSRAVRPALLFSHRLRRDAIAYLVLLGGPRAPRTIRVEGAVAKYVRPDERSFAGLIKKVLARRDDESTSGFVEIKPGMAVARGGVEVALADMPGAALWILEEGALDAREADLSAPDVAFFLGDHRGFDEAARAVLVAAGARTIGVGPVSIHTEDVIAVLANELDRRGLSAPA